MKAKITQHNNCEIIKKFKSKQNQVYLVKKGTTKLLVLKKYSLQSSLIKEGSLLTVLKQKGLNVPKVYEKGRQHLVMEYLPGGSFIDILDAFEAGKVSHAYILEAFIKLCNWFGLFYSLMKKIKGQNMIFHDVNLRNFIFLSGQVYGIDFEDCREGGVEEDVGRLCAFVLTYDPTFTPKKIFLCRKIFRSFVMKFDLDYRLTVEEINKELRLIKARRNIEIQEKIIDKIIL